MMMKGLSLWQPWASLIATGAKRYETRSWPTNYRGPLLICAAKGGLPKRELADLLRQKEFRMGLSPVKGQPLSLAAETWAGVWAEDLPFGKAVAVVDLINCYPTENVKIPPLDYERLYGDFTPGRYAWKLDNVRALREPIPVKGAQGLFDVDESVVSEIMRTRWIHR